MTLNELNQLSAVDAYNWFMQTCTASKWCEQMQKKRPYADLDALKTTASSCWRTMQKSDYLEAFQGHPMIGDVNSLKKKYANTKHLASNEQSSVSQANNATLEALHLNNQAYLTQHGFIFIICATGLSADEMLAALQSRLYNSTETEIHHAAAEQLNITMLRINKALTQ